MNGDDQRSEIVRLEAQIDELEATIESCRKFIVAGRIAVASGGVVLFAMLVGGIQFNPSVMGIAGAAVLGGIVAAGSNRSTAKEALRELTALDAKRAALIEQLDLRIVPDRDRFFASGDPTRHSRQSRVATADCVVRTSLFVIDAADRTAGGKA